jgi:hypothetical protein
MIREFKLNNIEVMYTLFQSVDEDYEMDAVKVLRWSYGG